MKATIIGGMKRLYSVSGPQEIPRWQQSCFFHDKPSWTLETLDYSVVTGVYEEFRCAQMQWLEQHSQRRRDPPHNHDSTRVDEQLQLGL